MKLPRTTTLAAGATAVAASLLAWADATFSWTDEQLAASSGAALATVGLLAFLLEHLRRETPSRWVGVLGMIPAEASGIVTLGIVFAWWGESALTVSAFVLALVTPLAALAGVTVAQSKVYAPETRDAELVETALEVSGAKAATPELYAR